MKRLLAPASEVARAFQPVNAPNTDTGWKARATAKVGRRVPAAAWGLALAGVLAIAVIAVLQLRKGPDAGAGTRLPFKEISASPVVATISEKSIAVLPFENRNTEKEDEFFTDGMHGDIITHLAQLHELRVVSRTSVMEYRGRKENVRQIAQKLGVTYLLEGSVQRAGNRVRVSGQLIRAATDEHIWAHAYDRELTDIFSLQSELAQAIAGALRAALSPQEKKLIETRPTENLVAYDLYLKARAGQDALRPFTERIALLNAAVQLDPKFAAGWALLGAEASNVARYDYTTSVTANVARAKAAVDHAVRLAPDASATLIAQARYMMWLEKDYTAATRLIERVLRQTPNEPIAFAGLETIARVEGRWPDALRHIRQAIRLDPGNLAHVRQVMTMLAAGRRYDDERVERLKLMDSRQENVSGAYDVALVSFRATGSKREVEQFFSGLAATDVNATDVLKCKQDWAMINGDLSEYRPATQPNPAPRSRINMALVFFARGNRLAAQAEVSDTAALRSQLELRPTDPWLWSDLSCMEALLGHRDEALRAVRRAMELEPESANAATGPQRSASLAFVHAWTGDKDAAIAEYARLLRVPFSGLNVHAMKRHPAFAPLQGDPRFEALLDDPKNNAPLF